MKPLNAVLLMSDATSSRVCDLASQAGILLNATSVSDLETLLDAFSTSKDLLLSFGTSVIVPSGILRTPGLLAINVHAASPGYPGRDPHHFAIYDGVTRYGATMHYMTEAVDAGAIIDTEYFDVPPDITPSGLLDLANKAGWKLIRRFFERCREHGAPKPVESLEWGVRKSTRKMFMDLCQIDPSMPKEEVDRRYRATTMPGYRNLQINLHGYRFRIEEPVK